MICSPMELLVVDDGRRFQPDVIVKLPGEKHIIIDAKVSLKAYEQWVQAEPGPARIWR